MRWHVRPKGGSSSQLPELVQSSEEACERSESDPHLNWRFRQPNAPPAIRALWIPIARRRHCNSQRTGRAALTGSGARNAAFATRSGERNIVLKLRDQFCEYLEIIHRLLARQVCHECGGWRRYVRYPDRSSSVGRLRAGTRQGSVAQQTAVRQHRGRRSESCARSRILTRAIPR